MVAVCGGRILVLRRSSEARVRVRVRVRVHRVMRLMMSAMKAFVGVVYMREPTRVGVGVGVARHLELRSA